MAKCCLPSVAKWRRREGKKGKAGSVTRQCSKSVSKLVAAVLDGS